VLVLAGDILVADELHRHARTDISYSLDVLNAMGSRQRKAIEYRHFISRVSFQFPHVIVVAGNHELYHGKWLQSIETLREEYAAYPNVHFLERDIFTFADVTFVGGTLWTDMNRGDPLTLHAVADMMNDYRMIRHDGQGYTKLRPAHTMQRHKETLDYFKAIIDDRKDHKIAVISHMAPSSLSVHEKYKHEHLVNGAYFSDLSEFILDRPQIKLWVHGHMHNDSDYEIGECRVVCNPRGYVGYERGGQEIDPFYPKIVEI